MAASPYTSWLNCRSVTISSRAAVREISTISPSNRSASGVFGQTLWKKLTVKARAQTMAISIERLAICGCALCQSPNQGELMPSRLTLVTIRQLCAAASQRLTAARE
ncbi:hypothetical protein D3C78_1601590 [compost metagenome]